MNEIYSKIDSLDSLEQEKIFLIQKYSDLQKIEWNTYLNHTDAGVTFGGKNIFELFECIGNDEKMMKKILFSWYVDTHTFLHNEKQLRFDSQKKVATVNDKEIELSNEKKLAIAGEINLYVNIMLQDILRYIVLKNEIQNLKDEKLSIQGEQRKLSEVADFYKKTILKQIKTQKVNEQLRGDTPIQLKEEIDEELLEFLGCSSQNVEANGEVHDISWKYNFFKQVQKSVEKGYVFTYREMMMMQDIVTDLQNGEVVMMTGDTGSGKTELAKFLVKEFLNTDYVFVSGTKEAEVTDFTLEKTITSKSLLDTDSQVIDGKEKTNDEQVEKMFGNLIKSSEFKTVLKRKAKENGSSSEEIDAMIDSLNIFEKKLVTEYHLMGVYKAAKLGIPCIIDEVNIIRPEVFMALNDVLTKRADNVIQLPNALENIIVKKGFCIILTGNDPEQNSNAERYTAGRYKFDEASYNRLRVYAKNYLHQIDQTHNETRLDEPIEQTIDYLEENELYGVILMMMFGKKDGVLSSGKYGFELMKQDLEGKHISKDEFFDSIKHFANSISKIQKAFAGESIPLSGIHATFSLKDSINRKVFSMRNLQHVLTGYNKNTLPLDYHIYEEFIKQTTNPKEKYALLVAFAQHGFFADLITDKQDSSIKNVEKKIKLLKQQKNSLSLSDIENKRIITKQDIYKQYFDTMSLSDDFFSNQIEDIDQKSEEKSEEESFIDQGIEMDMDGLLELCDNLKILLEKHTILFSFENLYTLSSFFKVLSEEIEHIETKKYNKIGSILIRIYNILDENSTDESIEELLMNAMKDINSIKTKK